MTTAIIHGDPGSYKTSTLVSDYLVPAIKQGRVVVTNIRGVKSPHEIAELYGFPLLDTAQIIQVSFDEKGFLEMACFFHWAPPGALILMDEGQRVYPTRLRDFSPYDLRVDDPEIKRPKTVEDAFDSHRHMNWDIYISTPNIGKIHKEIRAVAEFGYRHKNMASLFSFMKGRYKKVTHNAENSGTALSHEITSSLLKIDVRCFDVYQSTATGQVKDSDSARSVGVFKRPKVQVIFLLLLGVAGFVFTRFGGDEPLPSMFTGVSPVTHGAVAAPSAVGTYQTPSGVPAGHADPRRRSKNPFNGLSIFLVGLVNGVYWFQVVYPDNSTQQFTQDELLAIGFKIANLSDRVLRLSYNTEDYLVMPRPLPQFHPGPTDNAQILTNQPLANL